MEMMEHEFQEYVTFFVTAKDGSEVELAVVDEFDFEDQHYVVAAVVEGDVVNDEERYIYLGVMEEEDFAVQKIEDEAEYERVAEAYLQMED